MQEKQKVTKFLLRKFKPGDEAKLVDFLNLCYPSGWGNIEQWKWLYSFYPSFERDNVLIIENNKQIVGHAGLHFRQIIIRGKKVPTVFLGDTAIHPDYQGSGLYTRLHQARLNIARAKGACLALTENAKGSITYHHNKKTGFIEIKRNRTYIKPINSERFFKGKISDFISRREKLKNLLLNLEVDLYLQFDKAEFSVEELLKGSSSNQPTNNKKGKVKVILAESSLPLLIELGGGGKFRKVRAFLGSLFSRKVKVSFSSPIALGKVIWTGLRFLKYV